MATIDIESMCESDNTQKAATSSKGDEINNKTKAFRWNNEKINALLNCIQDYKSKLSYKGLDFDADRPLQYRCIRKEMAKIYATEPSSFGPVETKISEVPLEELTAEEKKSFLAKKKKDNEAIARGHTRIQEKIKEIRKSFSKAVTAGTRSGSGKIVYEYYDDLVQIWGGSPSSEPLSFGVSSSNFNNNKVQEQDGEENQIVEDEDEAQVSTVDTVEERMSTPKANLKRPAVNSVPRLIDNKRKHLEKSLSAAQRDKMLFAEARDDKEAKRDLASSMRESSQSFTNAMQNMSGSLLQLANGITKSIEMLSASMLTGQLQQPMNQNLFYQNPGQNYQMPPYQGLQQEQFWQQRVQNMQRRHGSQNLQPTSQPEELDDENVYQAL